MFKLVHMILSGKHKINFNIAILPIAISVILLCAGCQQHSKSVSQVCRSMATASVSTSACIDVEGRVWAALNHVQKYIFINPPI